jgi:crotonobetainyl-CoA:carnitine CoA-transferase CaiB-like acyl-CoA transferase
VKRHTPITVDRALSAYIMCGNNASEAERLLRSYGDTDVPSHQSIRGWAEKHADRLHELREELHPQIAKKIAADAEGLALKLAQAEETITEHLLLAVDAGELPAKELSGALRNISTSKALQVDKLSSPLRGRPTVIHGNQDPAETLANLARKLGLPQNEERPALGGPSDPA